MNTGLKSLLQRTTAALAASCFWMATATAAPDMSSARRVGPQRVILTARLTGPAGCLQLGEIGFGAPRGGFLGKAREEAILVMVDVLNEGQACDALGPLPEKRATLKVKPETKWLTVTFMDTADRVYKTERIRIGQ